MVELLRGLVRAACLAETEVTRPVRGYERRYRVLNLTPLGNRVMRQMEAGFGMIFPALGALAPARSRASTKSSSAGAGAGEAPLGPEETGIREQGKEWSGVEIRLRELEKFKQAVGEDF